MEDTGNSNPDIEQISSEIDMNSGDVEVAEEHGLGIPKLGETKISLRDEMRAASEGSVKAEQELAGAEEEIEVGISEEEYVKPKGKQYKNPDARIRRLEKEREALEFSILQREQQLEDMAINLQRMQNDVYTRLSELTPQGDPGEEIDPDLDPIGAQNAALQAMHRELQQIKQENEARAIAERRENYVNKADALIAAKISENPDTHKAAMAHLASVVFQAANQNMPHLTSNEKLQATKEWISDQKAAWVAAGIHPGEQLLKLAYEYGFQDQATPRPRQQDPNRAAVQQGKRRVAATSTLGGVEGTAPNTFSGAAFKNMDEEQFNQSVNGLIKAGKLTPGRSIGKTPRLSTLLPGKGIRIR